MRRRFASILATRRTQPKAAPVERSLCHLRRIVPRYQSEARPPSIYREARIFTSTSTGIETRVRVEVMVMSSPSQIREEHDRPCLWLPEPMTKVPPVATHTSRSSWLGLRCVDRPSRPHCRPVSRHPRARFGRSSSSRANDCSAAAAARGTLLASGERQALASLSHGCVRIASNTVRPGVDCSGISR